MNNAIEYGPLSTGDCPPSALGSRRGRVVEIQGEGVWIELDAESVCGACQTQSICAKRGSRRLFVPLTDGHALVCGSEIFLEVVGASLNHAVWFAYGVPLLGCIGMATLLKFLFPANELVAIAGAISGLVFGFLILWLVGRKQSAPVLRVRPHRCA